jgi:hypothetical protein
VPLLDINDPEFQEQLFGLEKAELVALVKGLRKLRALSWAQVYKDNGFKWELARTTKDAQYYSIRVTQKIRALVTRRGEYVVFVSLHPDHDSAYK